MSNTTHRSQSVTPEPIAFVVAGAAAINAHVFSPLGGQGFFAIGLLGPILSGFVAAMSATGTAARPGLEGREGPVEGFPRREERPWRATL